MSGWSAGGPFKWRTGVVLCLLVTLLVLSGVGQSARASETSIAVDLQEYVVTLPVDPYGDDPAAVHVAVVGGQEVARTYVHLALPESLGDAAGLTLTLHPTADAADNAGSAQAIIQACSLTEPLTADLDPSEPPAHDCSVASSVGKRGPDGQQWTFALDALLRHWRAATNTGLALVAVPDTPAASWSVAFDRGRSAATLATAAPSGASPVAGPPPTQAIVAEPSPLTTAALAPLGPPAAPATSAAPAAAAPAVEQPASSLPEMASRTVSFVPNGRWPWLVVAVLGLAAALMVGPMRRMRASGALAGGWAAVTRRLAMGNGRAVGTAALAVVWAITFAVYSVVVPTTKTVASGPGPAEAAEASAAGDVASQAPGSTSASTATTASSGGEGEGEGATQTGGDTSAPTAGGPATGSVDQAAGSSAVPEADLFAPDRERIGITADTIKLCGHAALTFAPAFDIGVEDIRVFWQYLNSRGGIHGRTVEFSLHDDGYDPARAVQAAQRCKDNGAFLMVGGIGFDQIPAVRAWAEQNRELYLHHIAVQGGAEALRYSFTSEPSVEALGASFGALAVERYRDLKVGIIRRNSPNWDPGASRFEKAVEAAGMEIVGDYRVQNNQGVYTQELVQLRNAGAELVLVWDNALAVTQILKQADSQGYHPQMLVPPFNLSLVAAERDEVLDPPVVGALTWPAYTFGQYHPAYEDAQREFEAAYAKFSPDTNLDGAGGDLLWGTWLGFQKLASILDACGPDCTRDRVAGRLLSGYEVTVGGNCPMTFAKGSHIGGFFVDWYQAYARPDGRPAWKTTKRCVPTP